MRWLELRLTDFQLKHSYCWRTLLYSNVHTAGGSDAPIESPNPFLGMYDAIMRNDSKRERPIGSTFRPDECLSFAEALWIYTHEGAFAMNCESQLGAVVPQRIADLVIIDRRCVNDAAVLYDLRPAMVLVGGCVEFFRSNQRVNFVKGLQSFSSDNTLFSKTIGDDASFIPGRGGNLSGCESQVFGYCPCVFNGAFCLSL
jgi:hypothetical protein